MKGSDRFLIAIVVGALLVAGAAAASTLWHRSEPAYRAEAAPEDVAYNFLLALQKQDYARAYGYLSPQLQNYPRSVEQFAAEVGMPYPGSPERNAALEVAPAHVTGDLATVDVRETVFYSGGLFNSGENTIAYPVLLQRVNGAWKVINGGNHWNGNWQQPPRPLSEKWSLPEASPVLAARTPASTCPDPAPSWIPPGPPATCACAPLASPPARPGLVPPEVKPPWPYPGRAGQVRQEPKDLCLPCRVGQGGRARGQAGAGRTGGTGSARDWDGIRGGETTLALPGQGRAGAPAGAAGAQARVADRPGKGALRIETMPAGAPGG